MRASTASYAQSNNTLISKQWIAQVHINLSNLYLESGRILESLNELEDVKFEIGLVFAFNDCYTASMIDAKNADKVFIPLHLDIYEDEWKN